MERKACCALVLLLVWLAFEFAGARVYAASADLVTAKKQSEAKGLIFEDNRTDIIAKAKQQGGKIRVLSSLDPELFPHMTASFKKKYPFLDATMVEITGLDANERFLLELKAGVVKDFDVVQLSPERYPEYLPYAKRFDILGMAEQGVLGIEPKMVDPKNRTVVSLATVLFVGAYNKNLLSADIPAKPYAVDSAVQAVISPRAMPNSPNTSPQISSIPDLCQKSTRAAISISCMRVSENKSLGVLKPYVLDRPLTLALSPTKTWWRGEIAGCFDPTHVESRPARRAL